MNRLIILIIILLLTPFAVYSQNGGFYGKKNEISYNFMDIFRSTYSLEYKRIFSNRVGLWLTGSYIHDNYDLTFEEEIEDNSSDDEDYKFVEVIPLESYGKTIGYGMKLGGGVIFNANTGMSLPMGHYMGVGYVNTFCDYTEQVDTIPEISFDYLQKGHNIRFILGRESYISKTIVFDIYTTFGYSFGYIEEENKNSRASAEFVSPPNGLFAIEPDYNYDDLYKRNYSRMYFNVGVKLGYLF